MCVCVSVGACNDLSWSPGVCVSGWTMTHFVFLNDGIFPTPYSNAVFPLIHFLFWSCTLLKSCNSIIQVSTICSCLIQKEKLCALAKINIMYCILFTIICLTVMATFVLFCSWENAVKEVLLFGKSDSPREKTWSFDLYSVHRSETLSWLQQLQPFSVKTSKLWKTLGFTFWTSSSINKQYQEIS